MVLMASKDLRDLSGNDISGNALGRAVFVGYKSEKAGEGLLLKLLRASPDGKTSERAASQEAAQQPQATIGRPNEFDSKLQTTDATSARQPGIASRLTEIQISYSSSAILTVEDGTIAAVDAAAGRSEPAPSMALKMANFQRTIYAQPRRRCPPSPPRSKFEGKRPRRARDRGMHLVQSSPRNKETDQLMSCNDSGTTGQNVRPHQKRLGSERFCALLTTLGISWKGAGEVL
ncbi:hypothetical protein THAOC_12185, partial [Thalassiosira oceanica]